MQPTVADCLDGECANISVSLSLFLLLLCKAFRECSGGPAGASSEYKQSSSFLGGLAAHLRIRTTAFCSHWKRRHSLLSKNLTERMVQSGLFFSSSFNLIS